MKYEAINRRFTESSAEWMAKGYHINTASMGGSQGEVAHLDLTNGEEIVRIVLESFRDCNYEEGLDGEGLELKIGHVTDNVIPDSCRTWGETVWNQHLEIISSERFYQIGREKRNGEKWYGTREEAIAQSKARYERYKVRRDREHKREAMPEAAKAAVLPFIKRQPKCKSMKLSGIESVEKVTNISSFDGSVHSYYEITVKGKSYRLG